ncbi:MAG: hypothetical protein WA151_17150, partial [Desulfatirhabdiaceae bacterium]
MTPDKVKNARGKILFERKFYGASWGRPPYIYIYIISKVCYQTFMPRKARIDAPGAVHHIIVRGIERGI